MRDTKSCLVLLMICLAVTVTSCGKKDSAAKKKSESQVVAIVNGDEITIHQVNNQMAQMGQMNKAQAKLASKQVLAGLVEQQLLKQQAIDAKETTIDIGGSLGTFQTGKQFIQRIQAA